MSDKKEKPKLLIDIEGLDLSTLGDSAILSLMDEKTKEDIIQRTMAFLKSSAGSYTSKTVLAEMFESAVRSTTRNLAEEYIEKSPQFIAEIKRVIEAGLNGWLQQDKSKLISSITDVITTRIFER